MGILGYKPGPAEDFGISALDSYVFTGTLQDATTVTSGGTLGNGYFYCGPNYVSGGDSVVRLFIYEIGIDDASSPLIAQSSMVSIPAGTGMSWSQFTFAPVEIVAGKTYMVVVAQEDGTWPSRGTAMAIRPEPRVQRVFYEGASLNNAPANLTSFQDEEILNYGFFVYAEYTEPPRTAFAVLYEFNGSNTPGNSTGALATNINFGNTDAADLVPADSPIPVGTNSFFKQLVVDFSGAYTEISNMKLYKSDGGYVKGETIQFSGNVTASTPTTVDQGDLLIPTGLPESNNVAPQGGTTADTLPAPGEIESSPGYYSGSRTSLMRFQLLSTEDTPTINGNQKTISLTYDRQ